MPISAAPGDDVRYLPFRRGPGEPLVSMHVTREHYLRMPLSGLESLVQRSSHLGATRVKIIGRKRRMMHRHENRFLRVGLAQFSNKPIQLVVAYESAFGNVGVETYDRRERRNQRPVDDRKST